MGTKLCKVAKAALVKLHELVCGQAGTDRYETGQESIILQNLVRLVSESQRHVETANDESPYEELAFHLNRTVQRMEEVGLENFLPLDENVRCVCT